MKFFSLILSLAVLLAAFSSCATIPTVTKNEIDSVDALKKELKEELKADEKAGKPVDYRKREIVEKLDNYSTALTDKVKEEKQLKEETDLANNYRMIRKIFIALVAAGLGFLAWKYKDIILELIRKIPGVHI